ncbi:MAG: hypothetical protein ACJ8HF_16230, partial [Pseudomonas sp.]
EKPARNGEKAKFLFDFATKKVLQAETLIPISGADTANGSNRCSQTESRSRTPRKGEINTHPL